MTLEDFEKPKHKPHPHPQPQPHPQPHRRSTDIISVSEKFWKRVIAIFGVPAILGAMWLIVTLTINNAVKDIKNTVVDRTTIIPMFQRINTLEQKVAVLEAQQQDKDKAKR